MAGAGSAEPVAHSTDQEAACSNPSKHAQGEYCGDDQCLSGGGESWKGGNGMTEDWATSRAPGGSGRSGLVQLTVLLTTEEVQELEHQANVDRISVTDAIRRSLAIGRVAWEAQRRKARLVIQERGGDLRPVELPTAQ